MPHDLDLHISKVFRAVMRGNEPFKCLLMASRSCPLSPHTMLDHWKETVPGFDKYLDDAHDARFSVAYVDKLTPDMLLLMPETERCKLLGLFNISRLDEVNNTVADGPDKFLTLATLAFLGHGPRKMPKHFKGPKGVSVSFPRSPSTDPYHLWPIFVEAFPSAAEAMVGTSQSKVGSKRRADDATREPKKGYRDEISDISKKLDKLMENNERILSLMEAGNSEDVV